jgi:transcriptional regulator with XRE-family HTH domain
MTSIGERLKYLLSERNMTQKELAKALNVSSQMISMLCSGARTNSKLLPLIAKSFGVDINWLKNGQNQNDSNLTPKDISVYTNFHKIPLFNKLNKGMLNGSRLVTPLNYENYELVKQDDFKNLFAMETTNNSLQFKFGEETTLIFNTSLKPAIGDFVVAYLKSKNLFVYRDLTIKNGKLVLVPIDHDLYKEIYIDETDCFIVAVLYEKRIRRTINEKMESWKLEDPSVLMT